MLASRPPKKVRRVRPDLEANRIAKKQTAAKNRSNASKRKEDARRKNTQQILERSQLQQDAAKASGDEAEAISKKIEDLDRQIEASTVEMNDAEEEESRYETEEQEIEMQDVTEEIEEEETEDNDPNKAHESIETPDTVQPNISDIIARLQSGERLEDRIEVLNINVGVELRDTQAPLCWKDSIGKPVIVVDCELQKNRIYRIRKDVVFRQPDRNLMRWRRAGTVRDHKNNQKWGVEDIERIEGIAIEVPPGYSGYPEELVKLVPRLSKKEKEALMRQNKPIPEEPKQPDVQLCIQWKVGVVPLGETKPRFTSWESRSGCRAIWKKHNVADAYLVYVAKKREEAYRNAGGRHSLEPSPSPLQVWRAGSTPPPGDTPALLTMVTPESTPPSEGPPLGDKPGGSTNKSDEKKAARAEFKVTWCEDRGIEPEKMTDAQVGSMMAAFKSYWDALHKA